MDNKKHLATLPNAIESNLKHLSTIRQHSPNTVKNYQKDLTLFNQHCEGSNTTNVTSIKSANIRQHIAQQHRQGKSGKSLQRHLSSIRELMSYLIQEDCLSTNPGIGISAPIAISAPKSPRKLPHTLDADQTSQLLSINAISTKTNDLPTKSLCNNTSQINNTILTTRDKAILELFYSSGLRLSELANLDTNHYSASDRSVKVLGKGNKEGTVPQQRWQSIKTTIYTTAGPSERQHTS